MLFVRVVLALQKSEQNLQTELLYAFALPRTVLPVLMSCSSVTPVIHLVDPYPQTPDDQPKFSVFSSVHSLCRIFYGF